VSTEEGIATDMNKGYIAAILEHLPKADIVFDHYHISALMNKGLDELRRKQQNDLDMIGQKTLKGSRYLLLSNYSGSTGFPPEKSIHKYEKKYILS
jgi:transposase